MEIVHDWLAYEANFKGQPWIDFTREHTEIPVFAVCTYVWIVFYVPNILKDYGGFKLRVPFAAWNLFLAVFSTIGTSRTVPFLYKSWQNDGFTSTTCKDPKDWYLDGPVGLWVALFIFSKIPELLDTVFLVLQKKRVIFLHWFHHVTVMLYCWHAFHNRVASGLWFTAMNLLVHSIMYSYYFLMAANLHFIASHFAPLITTIQILQMAVGSYVTWHSACMYYREGPKACAVNAANFKLGLAMYGAYFLLFCLLFYNKYFGAKQTSGQQRGNSDKICGVDIETKVSKVDTAGRFADFNRNGRSPPSSPATQAATAPAMRTRSGGLANGKHHHHD